MRALMTVVATLIPTFWIVSLVIKWNDLTFIPASPAKLDIYLGHLIAWFNWVSSASGMHFWWQLGIWATIMVGLWVSKK